MIRWLLLLAPLGLLFACENSVSDGDGTGGSSSSSGTTSTSSSGSTSGTGGASSTSSGTAGAGACPAAEPEDGSPCAEEGMACEYEDGVVVMCRGFYTCTSGSWVGAWPGCSSDPGTLSNCPSTPPGGDPCTLSSGDAGLCFYDDGTHCGCTNCLGGPCGGPTQWVCAAPPGGGCPPAAPNFGHACAPSGLECTYGSCSLGTEAQRDCVNGVWVDLGVPCPQ